MRHFLIRLSSLVFGLFLFAVGIVLTMQANVGYAPWDVFHAGLARVSGISIGIVSIFVGLAILVVVLLLGERFGLGTVLNMVLIGLFIDLLLGPVAVPRSSVWYLSWPMLIGGLFVIALGSFFYIRSGFGAGPRDSLMVALARRTRWPVGVCRAGVELAAVGGGWLLGGPVGVGTVVAAFAVGFCVQITFRLLRFDPKAVRHESLAETVLALRAGPAGGIEEGDQA